MRTTLVAAVAAVLVVSACNSGSSDTTATQSNATDTTAEPTSTSEAVLTTAATTTVAATATIETAASGTIEDPVPAGTWATVGSMTAVVLASEPDATAAVLAGNEFNEDPAPGNRFVMWRVALTNETDEVIQLFTEVSFSVVGPSAVAYDASAYCGVAPDQLDEFRDVFPGGTIEGNLCWKVEDADADELVLLVDSISAADDRIVLAAGDAEATGDVIYPTPAETDPDGPPGTRGNPRSIGDTVTVGDWDITVTGAIPSATVDVLGEDPLNDEPADGRQYFIVGIEATYNGTSSDLLVVSTSFNTVGSLGVAYTGADLCGVLPDEIDVFSEVFPGGTLSGNLCWSVKSGEADELLLYVQESVSLDEERTFFAVGY